MGRKRKEICKGNQISFGAVVKEVLYDSDDIKRI